MELNSIEDRLVILTKDTLDMFLRSEDPADLIALYVFYYYTAKWQKTNQPKCTTDYVAEGLKMSPVHVRKIKKELIDMGLIEDTQKRDAKGRVIGHYVKLKYIFSDTTLQQIQTSKIPTPWISQTVEPDTTNALSDNYINASSDNKRNALSDNKEMLSDCAVSEIVDYLNQKTGKNYRSTTPQTVTLIRARHSENFTVQDFKTVIDHMAEMWKGTENDQYLRPQTLFGTKFESYLNLNPKTARKPDKPQGYMGDESKFCKEEPYQWGEAVSAWLNEK